jgi:hypothetical protein
MLTSKTRVRVGIVDYKNSMTYRRGDDVINIRLPSQGVELTFERDF